MVSTPRSCNQSNEKKHRGRPEELAVQTNVPMVPAMDKHQMYSSRPRDSRPDTTTLYEARKPEETGTQAGTPILPVMDTLMYPCTPTGTSPPYYGGIHELDQNGKAHMQKTSMKRTVT